MSDPTIPAPAVNPQTAPPPARSRTRRWLTVSAIAVAAAVTGAVATQALDRGPPWRGGMMGPPFAFGGPLSPAAAEDRADRMVRHLSIEIDATAEQQDKLRGIVRGAVRDLMPLREKAQATRERGLALFTQQTVDRAAIESIRAEQMGLADEASRRIARALGDAAEVLNPEQRRKIEQHIAWRRHWRGWNRG
jgi:Spy/CpxP family protein refolding chaperone